MIGEFVWDPVAQFVNRVDELAVLDRWWDSHELMPMNLYGRRRSGKSWLFRRFAHGKPAVLLVARRTAPGAQLDDFADRLEPLLGVRPSLPDLATLFRVLYRSAREQKVLVVIDEFPYLLPTTEAEIQRELSAIQAVMEDEREGSQLKLVLCGSLVGQMESLFAEHSALYGRLFPLQLQPLAFENARLFLGGFEPLEQFERFAIAGGMPRYLSVFQETSKVRDIVCTQILDRNSALWDEGRTVLEQEFREPKVYFAILQALANGDKEINEIVQALRSDAKRVSKYLNVLSDMSVIERRMPVDAELTSRGGHWHLCDPFFRFWFRFVFPFQDDLESGLKAQDFFDAEIASTLNDHVAPEFEEFCRRWTRRQYGAQATKVGAWWGPALHGLQQSGKRQSEEIDIVGIKQGRVTLIGEARWRNARMSVDLLSSVDEHKLPALRQSGLKVAKQPQILLYSRGGYTQSLIDAADARGDVTLVDVKAALRS